MIACNFFHNPRQAQRRRCGWIQAQRRRCGWIHGEDGPWCPRKKIKFFVEPSNPTAVHPSSGSSFQRNTLVAAEAAMNAKVAGEM